MERSTSTLDIIATFCRVFHLQSHGYIKRIGDLNLALKGAGPSNVELTQGYNLVQPQNSLTVEIQQRQETCHNNQSAIGI